MNKENLAFLKDLIEAPSPSGYEQPAQRIMRERMAQHADEVRTDVHGNVIAALNPAGSPRVMLAGHLDEIGFIITHIEKEGYIRFAGIGGWDPNIIAGRRVWIHAKKRRVVGVIGVVPVHLMDDKEKARAVKVHNLFIDIGTKTREETEKLVEIGDPITMAYGFEMMENNLAVARGADDKAGGWVIAEALRICAQRRKSLKCALHAVATVQEELGIRGARTSAFSVDPEVGIAVDVTWTSDYPGIEMRRTGRIDVGAGPVLHRGANINPVVGEGLVATAKKKKIPFQVAACPRATGTDANSMQISRGGVATALISIPDRYLHSPIEVFSLDDIENAAKLIAEYVLTLNKKSSFIPE